MGDDDLIRRGDIGPAICKAGLHNLDKAIDAILALIGKVSHEHGEDNE